MSSVRITVTVDENDADEARAEIENVLAEAGIMAEVTR